MRIGSLAPPPARRCPKSLTVCSALRQRRRGGGYPRRGPPGARTSEQPASPIQGVWSSEVATGADPSSGRVNSSPGLPGSPSGIPSVGSDGRSQNRAAFPDFPITGAAWAPSHLLGKQREVRAGIVKLLHPTDGEAEVPKPSKKEASRLFGRSGQDPRESAGNQAGPQDPGSRLPNSLKGSHGGPIQEYKTASRSLGCKPAAVSPTLGERRGYSSTARRPALCDLATAGRVPMTRGVQPRLGRGEWGLWPQQDNETEMVKGKPRGLDPRPGSISRCIALGKSPHIPAPAPPPSFGGDHSRPFHTSG